MQMRRLLPGRHPLIGLAAMNRDADTYDKVGDGMDIRAQMKRARVHEFQRDIDLLSQSPVIRALQAGFDCYFLILNEYRQILSANRQLLVDLHLETDKSLLGLRPGEIFRCIHATEGPGGCGTAPACETCGFALTFLHSQSDGKPECGEYLATVTRNEAPEPLEFNIRTTPFYIQNRPFFIVAFRDISDLKRREALERIFFHDVLNTLTGLQGWSSLLTLDDPKIDTRQAAERIVHLAQRLTREIRDQNHLLQAENGTLEVCLQPESVQQLLNSLPPLFEAHEVTRGRHLNILDPGPDDWINTDASLLLRVLTNMIKNAFEATYPGETVRVSYQCLSGHPTFRVHNPGEIPQKITHRIFQRSFTTKNGGGRGLGTYSMKLFGERYLHGTVGFHTGPQHGTTFFIQLPENTNLLGEE